MSLPCCIFQLCVSDCVCTFASGQLCVCRLWRVSLMTINDNYFQCSVHYLAHLLKCDRMEKRVCVLVQYIPLSLSCSLPLCPSLFSPSLPLMYSALCDGWVTRWTPEGEGRPGHTTSSVFHPLFFTHSSSIFSHTVPSLIYILFQTAANAGTKLYPIIISLFLEHTTLFPMLKNYTVDLGVCVL